jgi:hypothetical protein
MATRIHDIHRWLTTRHKWLSMPLRVFTDIDPEYRPPIHILTEQPWDECIRVELGTNLGVIAEVRYQDGQEPWLNVLMVNVSGPGSGLAFSRVLLPALEASRGVLYAYLCWDEGVWRWDKRPDERLDRLKVVDGQVSISVAHRTSGRQRKDRDLDQMVFQSMKRLNALDELSGALNAIYLE